MNPPNTEPDDGYPPADFPGGELGESWDYWWNTQTPAQKGVVRNMARSRNTSLLYAATKWFGFDPNVHRPNPNPAETFAPPSDAHPSHQVLINKVVQAAQRVINAINDAGSHPAYHAEVKQKAQWAWPYLWDRLASLQLAFLDLEAPRSVSPDPDIEEPSE